MGSFLNHSISYSPDSAREIAQIAVSALLALGVGWPAPIKDLVLAAKVTDESDAEGIIKRFLKTLNEQRRSIFRASLRKLRGLADLRKQAIYVPSDTLPCGRFTNAHELGHQKIPWHHVNTEEMIPIYQDADYDRRSGSFFRFVHERKS